MKLKYLIPFIGLILIWNDIPHTESQRPYKSPAAHFKYWQNAHQPIWCSYGLYELKLALDLNGGMIFDENGTLLYSKIVNK